MLPKQGIIWGNGIVWNWTRRSVRLAVGRAMKLSQIGILIGAGWTVAAFVAMQGLRLFTNVVLAHLLAPELFGVMVLVNSLRTGVDLVSDVGIGQNIITHLNANERRYYNTAWSLQAIRGLLLWGACCLAAGPLAAAYNLPILGRVLPVAALYFVLIGFTSVSVFLVQKRMQVGRLNTFDLCLEFVSSALHVTLAWITQTVWALIFAGLLLSATRLVASYFLLPDVKIRFFLSRPYVKDILLFGKWIFLSSIVYYFAVSYDRLYLAKVAPLGLLGIYGIARTFADLISGLVVRLSSLIIFPLIASAADMPRSALRTTLTPLRIRFLLLAAVGLAFFAVSADLMISMLYDKRYQSAGWMISILSIGAWISIMCSVNESALMGLRQPLFGAAANALKFVWLIVGLPLAYNFFGVVGVTIVVALSDIARYVPIFVGQLKHGFSFGLQDASATAVLLGSMGLLEWLRWSMHFGTSFDGLVSMISN